MLKALKLFYWDIQDSEARFHFLNAILGAIPGRIGPHLRQRWIARYFKHAGDDLRLFEGISFRGIQSLSVGNRVHIGVNCFIQASGGVEMGDDVILGPGVKIWSINHVFADPDTPIHDQGYEKKPVRIGNDVWIGANAFIMPGADIGDGAIISANAVVGGKVIAPYSILAGNPARKIGSRKKKTEEKAEAAAAEAGDDEPARTRRP